MKFEISGGNPQAKIELVNQKIENGIFYAEVVMRLQERAVPQKFKITWKMPAKDCYSVWSPSLRDSRHLGPNWSKRRTEARLAAWMPLQSVLSLGGRNRLTIALSDAATPTAIATGICEEDGCIDCAAEFFILPTAPVEEYRAVLRLDTRDIPYYDSIYDVVGWWESRYMPAPVPEAAKLPMDSLWYSFHQLLNREEILEECRLAKAVGMETVIIDDGWQTDDNSRGYAYCGDWKAASSKIPDMKELTDQLHAIGMRVMLWYSVPFVGVHSAAYTQFRDMLLDGSGNGRDFWALDPRYPQVRKYLTETYEEAVAAWGLDGLKLDFIDSFILRGKSMEEDPRRDYTSLEDGVDALMKEITAALYRRNPEILIEFRQTYVGPNIRRYGNMLRVADCPDDALRNREDVVNLRLTSGKTAVHSDMLMWHYDDSAESAAMQLVSVLYSVPQISMRLNRLREEHRQMLTYYLSFWRKNREILLEGKLTASNPEAGYSQVCASLGEKAVLTVYTQPVIDGAYAEFTAVNGTGGQSLYFKNCTGKRYRIVDCRGRETDTGVFGTEPIAELSVPCVGMVFIQ